MADTLESLEIEVKHEANGAAGSIYEVTEAIRQMGRTLGAVLPQMQSYATALKNISGAKVAKGWGQKQQERLESPDPGASESVTSALDGSDIQSAENAVSRLGNIASRIGSNFSGAFGTMKSDVQKLASLLHSTSNEAAKTEKTTKDAADGVKKLAKEAKKSQKPLGTLVSSLKRIAFYRIIRGAIKAITQSFQEGLQYAYEFSAGIDGEGHRFAEAMDSMKTSATTMKAQLGSAFISLLAGIMPILMQLISLVTKAADAIAQLFAALTGSTYLKAADVPQKWGDAAGGAGRDPPGRGRAVRHRRQARVRGRDRPGRAGPGSRRGGGRG